MRTQNLLTTAFALAFAATIFAHEGRDEVIPHYSVSAPLGSGKVKTYVTLAKRDQQNRGRRAPSEMGVEIPASVMSSLPGTAASLAIDFPVTARDTPFQYMMLDWNPGGHAPSGVYDLPHFDFHFYIQDLEEVLDIKPGSCSGVDCEDYAKAVKPVPAPYNPAGYIDVGSVVPYMGNHLIDPASAEFNGQRFTRTFIYGAYDGEITFYEPMITRQSMMEQPNGCTAIRLPAAFKESGYYPTKYCTEFDAKQKVYKVFMQDFVYREKQ